MCADIGGNCVGLNAKLYILLSSNILVESGKIYHEIIGDDMYEPKRI